jgi:hypothetical protein
MPPRPAPHTSQQAPRSLYHAADVAEIIARIEQLSAASQRKWGTMSVAQMLAHCNVSLETALGLNFPKRKWIGRILGKLLKMKFLDSKPMVKNSITEDSYITIHDPYDFEQEKMKAIELVRTFYANGPEKCTKHPHAYFGRLTPDEWAVLKWKHYDHHLRQFGV